MPHQAAKMTHLNVADYMDEVLILRKIIEEYSHLISVFDSDETDMDGYVISALLSSGKLTCGEKMCENAKAYIVAVWNSSACCSVFQPGWRLR